MQCPNCKRPYDFGNTCPHCKVDTVLYKRIVRMSEKLYNQGLEKLQSQDFTAGIKLLTKSVSINKANTDARNLLGLALFEVGHVGEALTHWVISTSLLEKNNPAEDYLEQARKNSRVLEKLNDSIIMYNTALGHIKNKSDDLAIIQLKRAVENNPRFVDALNLLALCHLIQNDKERALSAVERVLAIDAKNPQAMGYYSMLSSGKTRPIRPITNTAKLSPVAGGKPGPYNKAIDIPDKKSTNFHITEILSFVVGVACAIAIVYFLMYPSFLADHERQITGIRLQMTQAEEAHQEQVQALENEKDELQSEIDARDDIIDGLHRVAELYDRKMRVNQAYFFFRDNQWREAVDAVEDIDTSGLPFDILARIDAILEGSYPRLATIYFQAGRTAFNAQDFYKALIDLEEAYRFMVPDTSVQWRELLFMLGSLYYNAGRLPEALEMLTTLRENFPNHMPLRTGNMIRSIESRM